jgi:hypothetical protein
VYKVVFVKYEKKPPDRPRHTWKNILKKELKGIG